MATVRAIIRKNKGRYITNEAGQCVVYAQYGHNAKTFLVNTDVHVTPPEWSMGKQAVIYNKSDIRGEELRKSFEKKVRLENALISKIKNELISISSALILKDKDPTIELVKEIYHNRDGLENQGIFISEFEVFMNDNRDKITKGTARLYTSTLNHLRKYLEIINKEKITVTEFNFKIISGFKNYLVEKGNGPGSVNNQLTRVKKFLRQQTKDKKSAINIELNTYKVEDRQKIYLTDHDLKALFDFDPGIERLRKIKDVFLLQCLTGLRYSDVAQLRPEHIQGDVIRITTIKTNKPLEIPLMKFAQDIIEKYRGDMPVISNQNYNRYLKELIALSPLESKMILPSYHGKTRKDEIVNRSSLITSHVGKKTFVMLCVDQGIDVSKVAAITGNNPKSLKHYYEIRAKVKRRYLKDVEESLQGILTVS